MGKQRTNTKTKFNTLHVLPTRAFHQLCLFITYTVIWHRRGVKEAIWERVENPSLNKKGGLRHALSHTWDRAVNLIDSRLSRDIPRYVTGC